MLPGAVDGELFEKSLDGSASLEIISDLLYVADLVVPGVARLSRSVSSRSWMLCTTTGVCINPSNTELMAYDPALLQLLGPGVLVSGGLAKYADVL